MTESSVPKEGYYDGYIVDELTELRELVKDDWDGIIYVCGRERTGKTTFASQCAKFLDPTWSIDDMCWTGQQFKDMVLRSKPNKCIVLDEAYLTFANSRRMEQLNNEIIGMLTMIGKKNLFIIIVAPTFWGMSEYLLVHRTIAMFRIYANGKERGFWELYGYEAKEQLYYKGKQHKSFKIVSPNRRGGFGSWVPYDKSEYDKRKEAAIQELSDKNKQEKAVSGLNIKKYRIEGAIWMLVQLDLVGMLPYGGKKAGMNALQMKSSNFNQKIANYQAFSPFSLNIITQTTQTNYTKLLTESNEQKEEDDSND